MMTPIRLSLAAIGAALAALLLLSPGAATAASRAEIDRDAHAALQNLYGSIPAAKILGEKAKAILVFPSIIKGGFIFGGQCGDGALIKRGKTVGYYNSLAASYGLQAGIQEFGYAMFFMTESALAYLDQSDGFEVGVGPSIVIVDQDTAAAYAKTLTTSTLQKDIYAFVFSQKGLMAGLGLQGSKITRIYPE